ncbi:MAG: hypothetical protein OXJ37_03195 [Bryobacterales bacterium]|nr:hypothetical protein [Bryobacterales bacterium]MDE0261391.1 hypothetical protein [Bryobacterales bacterium]MDE0622337.1 hypothetical protein [Bryobacterales bacterium]
MFPPRLVFAPLLLLAVAEWAAAAPAIGIRSVTNGISLADPPATVPRGGILTIRGEGLAGAHIGAESLPLPVALGDPVVEVLINGTAAPLFFVSPMQINAQIPWETPTGQAEVVVRVGEESSAPISVQVATINVALVRHDGTSAPIAESATLPTDAPPEPASSAPIALGSPGEPPSGTGVLLEATAAISAGSIIRVFASGIGETTPALATGSAAADTTYAMNPPQRAFLGGLPVESLSVVPSTDLVGVYQMTFSVPEMARPTEAYRWVSGNQGASGVMGPINEPAARYMAVPAGVTSADRIQLSTLNPYFASLSGALDSNQGCYPDVHLMDFRRDSVTTLTECLLPSWPNAPNPNVQHRPFESAANSSVLAALVAPDAALAAGLSDELLVVDTAAGASETVAIEGGTLRLQIGTGNSSTLRLERPSAESGNVVVDLSGTIVGEDEGSAAALPSPLVVGDLRYNLAQGWNFPRGHRFRVLGPDSLADGLGPQAVLFDADANAVAQVPFPDGWDPIEPPRRLNANGDPVGALSLAPVSGGFAGQTTAYVAARKSDRTRDGIVAFEIVLPPAPAPDAPDAPAATATMTAAAIEFPSGVFAANCTNAVRWLRVPATRTLAIVGSDQLLYDFAEPREGRLCAGDRVLLFDTESRDLTQITPGDDVRLDAWLRGTVNSYLYFGDGAREVAYMASTRIHVIDAVTGDYRNIVFPSDAEGTPMGIPYNNQQTQHLFSESKLVALATVGEPRVNNQGILLQPFAGDAGLLVVDLEAASATHLALPEGFERIEPGTFQLIQQGRRGFGMMPLVGRAFANVRRTGGGAFPGTGIVTWDLATAAPTVVALPDGAYSTVRPLGGPGANQRPFLWDFKEGSGAFAFGVYNEARGLMGVAVVGP